MEKQSVWRRRRRSNGRAVMRCESDAFSDCTVLAATPVNHDYNGEERWKQWCRKSRSDNYNARDKIMGTRCTLPIISCISCWLTHPHQPYPHWQPAITGHICEIQNELIWWQQWGLWSLSAYVCVSDCVHGFVNVKEYLPLASLLKCKIGIAWQHHWRMKRREATSTAIYVSSYLRMGVINQVNPNLRTNIFWLSHQRNLIIIHIIL